MSDLYSGFPRPPLDDVERETIASLKSPTPACTRPMLGWFLCTRDLDHDGDCVATSDGEIIARRRNP